MSARTLPRILSLLALWLLVAPGAPAYARPAAQALRVMSYNIHHGVGVDGALDLERIARLIDESGADVVGLQEVDRHWSERSDFADQAQRLADLLNMHHVYGANLDREPVVEGDPRRQYGTAILSRYPIVAWDNAALPNLGGEQRGLLSAIVRVGRSRVRVLNTHLQHDDADERAAQARAIAKVLDESELPTLLLGDLNAALGAAELAPVAARLDDAWLLGGEGPGYTIPVDAPDRRIDYVLIGRCMDARDAEVTHSVASDHLPVTATVSLPGRDRVARCRAGALARAHAHNDYEHDRPLFDALDHGFASLEADVWLVDGALLVAHDFEDLDPTRTFEALYLEPLLARVRENRGRVHEGFAHSLQLLIDIKSEGEATYLAVHERLARYRALFTTFVDGVAYEGPVTAVISGNRPRDLMAAQSLRFAGYDGRMGDLGDDSSAAFMPLISDRWTSHFAWTGEGEMPADQRARLHEIVAIAHAKGQRVRFWATPETPGVREPVWAELTAAGVDYINTDDLSGLRHWLRLEEAAPATPTLDWFHPEDAFFEWFGWLFWAR